MLKYALMRFCFLLENLRGHTYAGEVIYLADTMVYRL